MKATAAQRRRERERLAKVERDLRITPGTPESGYAIRGLANRFPDRGAAERFCAVLNETNPAKRRALIARYLEEERQGKLAFERRAAS